VACRDYGRKPEASIESGEKRASPPSLKTTQHLQNPRKSGEHEGEQSS